jgi:hypothetical protein
LTTSTSSGGTGGSMTAAPYDTKSR